MPFFEELEKEIFRSLRYDLPVSVIFADIDHFKTVNDSYGHLAGDHVLIRVADCLKTCLRSSDALARYGGEEFAIILPQTDEMGALVVAERLRQNIEHLHPEYDGRRVLVTMSFGIACFSCDLDATKNDLRSRADQAMYQAKKRGRNRCWSFSSHTKQGP
ncbi:MAG: GGDEF domain-containing protein [Desulfovermiculus sp.]|nr:GGDEF domain-containing protein [Desulfovermiculus sp.]